MTDEQRDHLERLSEHYASVGVRSAPEGSDVIFDCYSTGLPERCVFCGEDEPSHQNISDPLPWHFHAFRVAVPVRTYRVAPSGFRQRLDRLEQVAS
jgi:hypothetical protein